MLLTWLFMCLQGLQLTSLALSVRNDVDMLVKGLQFTA